MVVVADRGGVGGRGVVAMRSDLSFYFSLWAVKLRTLTWSEAVFLSMVGVES